MNVGFPREMIKEVESHLNDHDKLSLRLTCKSLYLDQKGAVKIWELIEVIYDRFAKGVNESSGKNLADCKISFINIFSSSSKKAAVFSLLMGTGISASEAIDSTLVHNFLDETVDQLYQSIQPNSAIAEYIPLAIAGASSALSHSLGLPGNAKPTFVFSNISNILQNNSEGIKGFRYSNETSQTIINTIFIGCFATAGGILALVNDLENSPGGKFSKDCCGIDFSSGLFSIFILSGSIVFEAAVLPNAVELVSEKYPLEIQKAANYASGAIKAAGGALEWFYEFGFNRAERALNSCLFTICDKIVEIRGSEGRVVSDVT